MPIISIPHISCNFLMHVCAHGGLSVGALTHVPNRFRQFCRDAAVTCLNLPAVLRRFTSLFVCLSLSRLCVMGWQLIVHLDTEKWGVNNRICASIAAISSITPSLLVAACHAMKMFAHKSFNSVYTLVRFWGGTFLISFYVIRMFTVLFS